MKKINFTDEQEVKDICHIATQICGLERGSLAYKTRKLQYTLPRSIVSNIARIDKGIHYNIIAKVLNRDRCSIYHYEKNHNDNYKRWNDYRNLYNRVYDSYITIRETKKKFKDSQHLRNHLISSGVMFSSKPNIFIDIDTGLFAVCVNTCLKDFSENLEIIRIAISGYMIKEIKVNFDEAFTK